jgi:hypothetical protein
MAAEAVAEAAAARNMTLHQQRERRRRIQIMGENEKASRAAQAHEFDVHSLHGNPDGRRRCYCAGCKARIARIRREIFENLDLEYLAYLAMRATEAERRSQEAARKRREDKDREAQERLTKE